MTRESNGRSALLGRIGVVTMLASCNAPTAAHDAGDLIDAREVRDGPARQDLPEAPRTVDVPADVPADVPTDVPTDIPDDAPARFDGPDATEPIADAAPARDIILDDGALPDANDGGAFCDGNEAWCSGACVDLAADPANCGGCGVRCPVVTGARLACIGGVCDFVCGVGWHRCEGRCADDRDTSSCGVSCTPCPTANHATPTCDGRRCGFVCLSGFADCDNDPSNGCETDLRLSATHCGACGVACTPGAACVGAVCRPICPEGLTVCLGECVDLQRSATHCGRCDAACAAGARCAAGRCEVIPSPRLVAPLSTELVTSRRPTVRVALPPGVDGVRVEFCATRTCARALAVVDAAGAEATPLTDLPPGVLWWRAIGRSGAIAGSTPTAPWALRIPHRSAARATRGLGRFDLTGDGVDDLLTLEAQCAAGPAAWVVEGTTERLNLTPRRAFVPNPPAGGFSPRVANAGDLNGDGYADAVMTVSSLSGDSSRVAVYYGPSSALPAPPSAVLTAPTTPRSFFGYALDGAGDVNGDGYADLLVGASGADGESGRAYLYLGGATGVRPTPSFELSPMTGASARVGSLVAGIGDVNGDGYADFAVGASGAARLFIYHGGPDGPSVVPTRTLSGDPEEEFAWSVDGAGDVNGDGYWDLLVGAISVRGRPGRAYVYHGGPMGLAATPTTTLQGSSSEYDGFGAVVAGGADVNGDGFGDVAIARWISPVRVFLGGSTGVSPSPSRTLSVYATDHIALPGDLDADGRDDVTVGAAQFDSYRGRIYFFSASGSSSTPTAFADGSGPGCRLGFWTAR